MRQHLLPVLAILALVGCGETPAPVAATSATHASALPWYTEFAPAAAEAVRTGRPILADVQGSDWCPACQELHELVFATPEFAAWAKGAVVLYNVDLPNETPQDPAIRKANEAFALKHQVTEFPGLILVNAQGERIAKVTLDYPFTRAGVMTAIAKVMPAQ
jgi:protein disulfide-isomerase